MSRFLFRLFSGIAIPTVAIEVEIPITLIIATENFVKINFVRNSDGNSAEISFGGNPMGKHK
jgi:hypothetical protein